MALFVFATVHLLVPLLLLSWQWRSPVESRIQWCARTLAFGGYLTVLLLAGYWIILPGWLAWLYLGLLAGASTVSWQRVRTRPWRPAAGARNRADVVVNFTFAVVFLAGAGYAALGRLPPGAEAVELGFPLRGGEFAVASAGSNRLVNFHLRTLNEPQLSQWRGQSHGIDIVELNDFGIRAAGFMPQDSRRYAIFGRQVLAPCSGRVVESRDDMPDSSGPEDDSAMRIGNHVMLDCEGYRIVLAHLREGSVSAKTGDRVTVGQTLGEVGNSGESGEPHLHIHAQRPGSATAALDGEPLPIRFGGRYLVRNDRARY